MIVFVIVIPVLLLGVALMLFSSLRRREAARATGTLSAETRKRDRPRAAARRRWPRAPPAATSSAARSWRAKAASSSRSARPHRRRPSSHRIRRRSA